MKVGLAQINPTIGDFDGNCRRIVAAAKDAMLRGAELTIFSEMCVMGYPARDLLEKPAFLAAQDRALERLQNELKAMPVIVGCVQRRNQPEGNPLYNSCALLEHGQIKAFANKCLLPTYDVFDEDRYFEASKAVTVVPFRGIKLGMAICEDYWNDKDFWSTQRKYPFDPVERLVAAGADVLVSINASPYAIGKMAAKEKMLSALAKKYSRPLLYANQVGGNDDLIFDGRSLAFDARGELLARGPAFDEAVTVVEVPVLPRVQSRRDDSVPTGVAPDGTLGQRDDMPTVGSIGPAAGMPLVDLKGLVVDKKALSMVSVSMAQVYHLVPVKFENGVLSVAMSDPQNVNCLDDLRFMLNCEVKGLVAPDAQVSAAIERLYGTAGVPKSVLISPLLKDEEEVYRALVLGTRDYARKCGFKTAVLGLSGGIDSALVAAIAVEAFGPQNVTGVAMPSRFNAPESLADAKDLAQRMGMPFHVIAIEELAVAFKHSLAEVFAGRKEDVTEENIQARIRGVLMMALSNKYGHLLLTTGNKSEVATGYCTLYGDMAGGLAVISDLYKTMVYRVAKWINAHNPQRPPIPESCITKAPSAELRYNQTDQDTLPPYEVLDGILKASIESLKSIDEIVALGYDREVVRRILRMVDLAEYKRRQAAPGLKITSKAFGTGRRMPIVQRFRE